MAVASEISALSSGRTVEKVNSRAVQSERISSSSGSVENERV
jgi:hypothetical protein